MMPALLTRMSSPPRPARVSSTTRCTGSVEPKSAEIDRNFRPSASTAAWVSTGAERPAAAMSAPAAAKATAMPWPMPVLAPVTRATLPVRSKGLVI